MGQASGPETCEKGEHELRWDDERGRLECVKCGMSSDRIMDQPGFGA